MSILIAGVAGNFFCLALLLMFFVPACMAQQTTRVSLVSRLEFDPVLLDSIRDIVMEKLNLPCSLVFHSSEDLLNNRLDKSFSHILVEEGIDTDSIQSEFYHDTEFLSLVWVLGVRGQGLKKLGDRSSLTIEEFFGILSELKQQSPNKFPWFEALRSRVTLRNFCLTWDVEPSTGNVSPSITRPVWEEYTAIQILYRSIEAELLNPLSVEADKVLSGNVFVADDACFSSMWVPVDVYLNQKSGDLHRYIPFPGRSEEYGVLRFRLSLWQRKPMIVNTRLDSPVADGVLPVNIIDLDYTRDQEWISRHFDERYDALIMGDFR